MSGQTLEKYMLPLAAGLQAVLNSNGLSYYRHADWLGSSRFAGTPSGTVQYNLAYAPFGETYAESGSVDRSFTGQTQDVIAGPTGIYDFLFRQQASSQGRWLVPDPAGLAAVDITNPQTWNRYAYVANNPLGNIDPLGLDCVTLQNGTVGDTESGSPCNNMTQGNGSADANVSADAPSWWTFVIQGLPQYAYCSFTGSCSPYPPGGGGGGDTSPPAPNPPKAPPVTFTCQGTPTYRGVGGNQATDQGALFSANGGPSVPGGTNGTVAISRDDNNTFNLSKAKLRVFGPYIQISPQGLTDLLTKNGGPQPPYTVSDIGDQHVKSGQFDIYRFPTKADGQNFGRRTAPTIITVPAVTGAQCPPGFTRVP